LTSNLHAKKAAERCFAAFIYLFDKQYQKTSKILAIIYYRKQNVQKAQFA
jgi:hypothetical protein